MTDMKRFVAIALVLLVAGVASALTNHWQMVTWPSSGHPSYLVDYTQGTSVVSSPRPLTPLTNPNSGVMGIDYAGAGGTLFAATTAFDNRVYSVDPVTGTVTEFASLPAAGAEGDLGYNPWDGMLYAVNGTGGSTNVFRIDPGSHSVTTVLSAVTGHGDISGIAFDSTGAGYMVDDIPGTSIAELLKLDVTTSPPVISDVGSLGIATLSTLGLRFDGSDVLHMVTQHGDFYSIDTTQGSPTANLIDHITINPESDPRGYFVGLAWVPEPGSLALLGLGLALLRRR